jgi:hypothetical protein
MTTIIKLRLIGLLAMIATVAPVAHAGAAGVLANASGLGGGSLATSAPSPATGVPTRIPRPPGYVAPAQRLATRAAPIEFFGHGACDVRFCWSPGEPVIAVGPTDIVQTVNTAATVYSKTGTQLAVLNFETFWGAGTSECVDPRALYIASVNRFAISCTDKAGPMRFAISKTADPTGAWYLYAAPNASFLDQDKIEATSDKFIIAGNGSSEMMYVYNLSDVVAGVAKPSVVTLAGKDSSLYQAVVEQTSVPSAYFVSSYPGGSLFLASITGTPAAGDVALNETAIASTDFPAPLEPQVPGGSIGGGELDGRIYDAVFETETSDGRPVIAYSSSRECGLRTCITRSKIDLSGTEPVLVANTLIGEPGWDYVYGAVGLAANGSAFEVYSRSSGATAPGLAVVGAHFDVTLQPAASGTSTCSGGTPPCDERWGDYFGTAIDPSARSSVWVTGMYQASNGASGWGSVIAKVSATAFSLPTATTGSASSLTATTATVAGSVNPKGVATTYHVDYGLSTGYDTATPEQSAGSGTTAVSVSVPLSGLDPATTYHYRIVATTSVGSAVGSDKTLKTNAPKFTAVTFTGTPTNPTVTITGSNFGTIPAANPASPVACVAGDTSFDYGVSGLWFNDATAGWTAGQTGDCIGLTVTSYTNTTVVYRFGAGYGHYGPLVTNGDAYALTVWGVSHSGTVAYS